MTGYRWFALLLVALLVSACGSTQPSSLAASGPVATAQPGSASPDQGSSGAPTSSGGASAPASGPAGESSGPSASVPPASNPPSPGSSESPSPGSSESPSPGAADACTGTDANRAFFLSVAAGVDWTVLCAVLPARWHVKTGHYSLRSGGSLEITYARPDGATLMLQEGFCSDVTACTPTGTDSGDASLGSLTGTLVALDGGGFGIVVDRGASPTWLMTTQGLGMAKTREFGAALAEVAG